MNLFGSATGQLKLTAIYWIVLGCIFMIPLSAKVGFARPHIVVDAETGKILAHHRAHRRWAPASLTKLMTTYVTFRAIKLQQINFNSPVTISSRASRLPPSKMGFPPGSVLTIDQAIKIIMVKSANDVALALGESVAGSEGAFVDLMNAHARRLGMTNTQFRNPHGLPDKAQFTTAVDMAKLGIAVQNEFPEYSKYLKVPGIIHGRRRMRNFNRLLTRFSGTTGMKTGYICASGYNVIVSAERKLSDGKKRKLIAVVMGQTSGRRRNAKAAEILHKGFQKRRDFGQVILADFEPPTKVNPKPADITEETCRRKKRNRNAKNAVNLKEIEARYMSKPVDIGSYHKIVLGGASGPNPHASRFRREKTKIAVIPFPTKRPSLICPVVPHDQDGLNKLQLIASSQGEKAQDEKVENLAVTIDVKKSAKVEYPTPKGCLPVPIARKDQPALETVVAGNSEVQPESSSKPQSTDDEPQTLLAETVKPQAPEEPLKTSPVTQAFDRFDESTLPIPTPRNQPVYLTSFAAPAENEGQPVKTRSLEIDQVGEPKSKNSTGQKEISAKTPAAPEDRVAKSNTEFPSESPETKSESIVEETPEKPVTTSQINKLAMIGEVVEPTKTEILQSGPKAENPINPDGEKIDQDEAIDVASLPPDFGVIPVKRPPYKVRDSRKRDRPKISNQEKSPSKDDAKKAKKPAKNPFAKNVCRAYRNSGCFPELFKAKKSGKKSANKSKAGVKKLPAHCPALQSLYRQNRKSGLNCSAS